jgi:hypothetical protein
MSGTCKDVHRVSAGADDRCSHAACRAVMVMTIRTRWGQSAERGSSPAAVGPLDPGHDRDAEFSRVAHVRRLRALFCSNDSMAVLSPAAPTFPIEPTIRCGSSARTNFRDRHCGPRSLCRTPGRRSPDEHSGPTDQADGS